MAAAFVSGEAALIWSQNPMLTAPEVKTRILESGDHVEGLLDKVAQGRMINAAYALNGFGVNSRIIPVPDETAEAMDPPETGSDDAFTLYADNEWKTKQPMPESSQFVSAVAVGSNIYVYVNHQFYRYNPGTEQWTLLPAVSGSLGSLLVNGKMMYINGKIYLTTSYFSPYETRIHEYNIASSTWSYKTSTPRVFCGIADYNGLIYVTGGKDGSEAIINLTQAYDPIGNTWTTLAAMTGSRANHNLALNNGKLYVIGGLNAGNIPDAGTYEYNPGSNTWSVKASNKKVAWQASAAVTRGVRTYVAGGIDATGYTGMVQEYDATENRWYARPSMPTRRGYLALAHVNGYLYAIGGTNGASHVNKVETLDLGWHTMKTGPDLRAGVLTEINEVLYAFGGYSADSPYPKKVYAYNDANDTWTAKADIPTPRAEFAVTVLGGKAYVIGGINDAATGKVEAYDPVTNTWQTKANMRYIRYGAAAVTTAGGRIMVTGGHPSEQIIRGRRQQ
jgi:N-acetylneuraminic acid mutarotase